MAQQDTHTSVDITVRLANGTRLSYGWYTPLSPGRAGNKALGWARLEMSRGDVPGRSRLASYTVDVVVKPGPYHGRQAV
jgi:hypothetical protein